MRIGRPIRTLQGAARILLRDLESASELYSGNTTEGARDGTVAALIACMEFVCSASDRVSGPEELRIIAIEQIFRNLAGALMELGSGSVAPILQPGPTQNRPNAPYQIRMGRANAAIAMDALCLAGFTRKAAAEYVAREIAERPELAGIKRDSWKAIVRWREDLMSFKNHAAGQLHSRSDVEHFQHWRRRTEGEAATYMTNRTAAISFAQKTLAALLPVSLPKKEG